MKNFITFFLKYYLIVQMCICINEVWSLRLGSTPPRGQVYPPLNTRPPTRPVYVPPPVAPSLPPNYIRLVPRPPKLNDPIITVPNTYNKNSAPLARRLDANQAIKLNDPIITVPNTYNKNSAPPAIRLDANRAAKSMPIVRNQNPNEKSSPAPILETFPKRNSFNLASMTSVVNNKPAQTSKVPLKFKSNSQPISETNSRRKSFSLGSMTANNNIRPAYTSTQSLKLKPISSPKLLSDTRSSSAKDADAPIKRKSYDLMSMTSVTNDRRAYSSTRTLKFNSISHPELLSDSRTPSVKAFDQNLRTKSFSLSSATPVSFNPPASTNNLPKEPLKFKDPAKHSEKISESKSQSNTDSESLATNDHSDSSPKSPSWKRMMLETGISSAGTSIGQGTTNIGFMLGTHYSGLDKLRYGNQSMSQPRALPPVSAAQSLPVGSTNNTASSKSSSEIGVNQQSVTNLELEQLSEKLLTMDTNNAMKHVLMNLQSKKLNMSDNNNTSPKPLFTVKETVYQIPTIKALLKLYDNYNLQSGSKQVTPEIIQEQRDLLHLFMNTTVMRTTMEFLFKKGFVKNNENNFESDLESLWFKPYLQYEKDCSAFESIFMASLVGKVVGARNWIYLAKQEEAQMIDYLGYYGEYKYGDRVSVINIKNIWLEYIVPVRKVIIGISPELEMALYTICYYTRIDQECTFKLGGNAISIKEDIYKVNPVVSLLTSAELS